MSAVWTVSYDWAYEGQSLQLATTDEIDAWRKLKELARGTTRQADTWIELRQWDGGSCIREVTANLGVLKEWKGLEWVVLDG